MVAAQQGNEKIVQILLERKPDLTMEDKFGKKAYDRSTNPSVFYLLQSAAIDQRIEISGNKVLTATTLPDDLSRTAHSASGLPTRRSCDGGTRSLNSKRNASHTATQPESAGQGRVFEYYKAQFSEQIAKLGQHLSTKVRERLAGAIDAELEKSEGLLRGILGNELAELTDKIKEQIDQHIQLKIRLASAKAGVPEVVDHLSTELPTTKLRDVQLGSLLTNNHIQHLAIPTAPLLQSQGSYSASPQTYTRPPLAQLPKDSRDLYNALSREMTRYVGKQLDDIAGRIASANLEQLLSAITKHIERVEKRIRSDVTTLLGRMTNDIKSRVDLVISERMTRAGKQMKDRIEAERQRIRSESLKFWLEDEKSRQDSAKSFEPSSLTESQKELLRPPSGATSRPRRLPATKPKSALLPVQLSEKSHNLPQKGSRTSSRPPSADGVSNGSQKLSVSSLQVAKESPIAHAGSVRDLGLVDLHVQSQRQDHRPDTNVSRTQYRTESQRQAKGKGKGKGKRELKGEEADKPKVYYMSLQQLAAEATRSVVPIPHANGPKPDLSLRAVPSSEHILRTACSNEPKVQTKSELEAKPAADIGLEAKSADIATTKAEGKETKESPTSTQGRLDLLYKQYANVYVKEPRVVDMTFPGRKQSTKENCPDLPQPASTQSHGLAERNSEGEAETALLKQRIRQRMRQV